MVRVPGVSPLASPAGAAHTPAAAPVGSGHDGFAGSALAPEKYAGSCGAAAAPPAGASSAALASRPPITVSTTSTASAPRIHRVSVMNESSLVVGVALDCLLAALAGADA